ncbi:hypothetical protein [Allosphingosinicella sp.]|uniref:hypothetical protein n=1 Tax=Allosphingosinicella sp. TaxID=2823234 RepID=UPI0037843838
MTVGSLLNGGFRLIRERPGAMLIWTLVQLIVAVATSFATTWIVQASFYAALSGEDVQSLQLTAALQFILLGLGGLVVSTILYAAVQRAILRPDEGGPGWLRLGMDEVRLFLLLLLCLFIFLLALLAVGLFLGAILYRASPGAAVAAIYIVGGIGGLLFGTKISLIFPLTLKKGAFAIGEGTSLSRGRFWTLLGTYLIIFLILLVLGILNVAVTQPDYLSAVFQHGFGSYEVEQATMLQSQKLIAGEIDAPVVIGWVLTAIQGAIGCALWGGAAATAVQQLTADEPGLSDTFS